MKFRTRLLVTFSTIVILPVMLAVLSILGIGFYIKYIGREAYGLDKVDFSLIMDPIHGFSRLTDEEYDELLDMIRISPEYMEDSKYLYNMEDKLKNKSSFLLVRKNDEITYTGNPEEAEKVYDSLVDYGMIKTSASDYYLSGLEEVIRQIDFTFSDGGEGSVFIVTKVTVFLNVSVVRNILLMAIAILTFTAFTLTRWIQKGVFTPIRDLNNAMKNIAEGNFDYKLPVPKKDRHKGEMEALYENYEQMRLQLKESADDNVQAEKQNKELISNISHDLKTPITSIKGYVEGIMDGVADTPEKMDKYIRTIYNKTNDMDRLINELTTYSNIDANRIPYHFHKINVSDYFNDCVEEVGLDLDSKHIKLCYENLVEPDTMIIADPEQMKRVVNNIIGNSVKYIDKREGTIDIRILDEVDSIRVEIEDNGKGIAPKELGHIFERFYRTDASRNSAQGGSGIGLSIVKKIVEDHGGYIWATSKETEGTCIHFVLRKYKEVVNQDVHVDAETV